jgi:hypothetical protein
MGTCARVCSYAFSEKSYNTGTFYLDMYIYMYVMHASDSFYDKALHATVCVLCRSVIGKPLKRWKGYQIYMKSSLVSASWLAG